jgi:tetratricopeptide (TPR) repeat protein
LFASALALAVMCGAAAGCQSGSSTPSWADSEKTPAADPDWERAAPPEPTPETRYALGRLMITTGQRETARTVFRRITEKWPSFAPAYNGLAELALHEERPEQAARWLRRGLEQARGADLLHNNLGMVHLMQDAPRAALRCFERAEEAAPEKRDYRANRAMAQALLGEYEPALKTYRAFMDAEDAHHNIAVLAKARGDLERARRARAKAGAAEGGASEGETSSDSSSAEAAHEEAESASTKVGAASNGELLSTLRRAVAGWRAFGQRLWERLQERSRAMPRVVVYADRPQTSSSWNIARPGPTTRPAGKSSAQTIEDVTRQGEALPGWAVDLIEGGRALARRVWSGLRTRTDDFARIVVVAEKQ